MTTFAKKVIVWLFTLFLLWSIVYSVNNILSNWKEAKKELSDKELCYGTWSTFEQQVTACGNIIKESQRNYALTVSKLSWYAESASWAREKIRVIAKDFYDKNLSGTNVNFQ